MSHRWLVFKVLILGAVCCWSMHGFLLNETLHVPFESDEDCSWCWLWILSACIMHLELLRCARELFLSGTLPQLTFTLLVLSPATLRCLCASGQCFSRYSWLQCDFSYHGKNFSPVFTPGQSCPCLLYVVTKTAVPRVQWQNFVADSHSGQAGRVSNLRAVQVRDPWEVPLFHTGVHCLLCGQGRTTKNTKSAGPRYQEHRICRQGHTTEHTESAGPRYRSVPRCGARCQAGRVLCPTHPGCQLAGESGGSVRLRGECLGKHREITLHFNLVKTLTSLLQCSLDTYPWNVGAVSEAAVTPELPALLSLFWAWWHAGHPSELLCPSQAGRGLFRGTHGHCAGGRGAADTPPPRDLLTLPSISPDLFTTLSEGEPRLSYPVNTSVRYRAVNVALINV